MKRFAIALLVLGVAGSLAHAQGPGPYVRPNPNPNNPYSRPIFSPYLNLARTNNNLGITPGINYAGIVRPEQQYYSDIGQLYRQGYQTQTALQGVEETNGLPLTGHPTQFMNVSHYYPGTLGSSFKTGATSGTQNYAAGAASQSGQAPQRPSTGAKAPRGR